MNIIQALILGLVEGLTEFLPISSTFHLIQASRLLGMPQSDFQKLFEVVIQSGAILAVIFIYWRIILNDFSFAKKILASFIPTAIVGLFLYKFIKGVLFTDFTLQIIIFALIGILFIFFEKVKTTNENKKLASAITYQEAVIVGIIQSFAVIPGVSRSGAVMLILMYLGVKRDEAAKYSFLLAVPTIFAASAYDLFKMHSTLGGANNLTLIFVGFLASAVSAFLIVKWFISYLQKNSIAVFGWYRIAASIILFFLPK